MKKTPPPVPIATMSSAADLPHALIPQATVDKILQLNSLLAQKILTADLHAELVGKSLGL